MPPPPAGLWPGLINALPKPLLVVPMVVQWLLLALRYRSLSLPSAADPSIPLGGLAGESKMVYFDQLEPAASRWVARTGVVRVDGNAIAAARDKRAALDLHFPVIAKPDIGWCGFGVRRLDDDAALDAYAASYPAGESFLLQEYLAGGEAGLFYVRWPGQTHGDVLSLTVREPPCVVGDGASTVRMLIERDPTLRRRAYDIDDPDGVLKVGETLPLSVVWSHRMGGRYTDLGTCLTPALTERIDRLATSMEEIHVARFDVRFESLDALAAGTFKIIEVNGAGSEAINFFDPAVPFFTAYRGVLAKQEMVFALAAENRRRGARACGWRALLKAYLRQQRLIARYPASN